MTPPDEGTRVTIVGVGPGDNGFLTLKAKQAIERKVSLTDAVIGPKGHSVEAQDERHRIFNSAAYLSQGEILSVHRKVYLPTYGLFDESRFFAWGDSSTMITME